MEGLQHGGITREVKPRNQSLPPGFSRHAIYHLIGWEVPYRVGGVSVVLQGCGNKTGRKSRFRRVGYGFKLLI